MKRIALVSITLNAVNPMTDYLARESDVSIVNYLDSYILEKVRREGKITPDCMRRMVSMLSHACEDGADGIIITCTIFSAYVPFFSQMFSVPMVGADVAMMDSAGKKGGRTAMVCTFKGTEKPSCDLLAESMRHYGNTPDIVPFVLNDAYEEAQKMNLHKHDEIIRSKVIEIESEFDNIIIAQISMANAVHNLKLSHAQLFTSPQAAYEVLTHKMKER